MVSSIWLQNHPTEENGRYLSLLVILTGMDKNPVGSTETQFIESFRNSSLSLLKSYSLGSRVLPMVLKPLAKDYNSEFTINNTQDFSIWEVPYEIIITHTTHIHTAHLTRLIRSFSSLFYTLIFM